MYPRTSQSSKKSGRPARWITRIYPSGAFACGRIPPEREKHHYNPGLLDYKRKVCVTRTYPSISYESTVQRRVYFQHRHTGRVMGHSSPDPNKILEIHRRWVLSNAVTPEGLTNTQGDGTQDSLGSGECESSADIGLSTVPSSRIRTRQGLKGITANGRRSVREGCTVLTAQFGKSHLGFYTLTLPYTGEALKEVVGSWEKIVHRYYEELGREYARRGQELRYVSVCEIQEKRWHATGDVAPHLHYVANAKVGKKFILLPHEIRDIFRKVCERFTSSTARFDSCENCQIVKKDAGKYLSKYFSKGGVVISTIAESQPESLPRRWWKIDADTKRDIVSDTVVLYDGESWRFIHCVKSLSSTNPENYSLESVYIDTGYKIEMLVGYRGKVPGVYERIPSPVRYTVDKFSAY